MSEYNGNIGGYLIHAYNVDSNFLNEMNYLKANLLKPEIIEHRLQRLKDEGYPIEVHIKIDRLRDFTILIF